MAPALDVGRRMRLQEPEQFHAMVKMHLRYFFLSSSRHYDCVSSFLLDLHTDDCDCSFLTEKTEKVTGGDLKPVVPHSSVLQWILS